MSTYDVYFFSKNVIGNNISMRGKIHKFADGDFAEIEDLSERMGIVEVNYNFPIKWDSNERCSFFIFSNVYACKLFTCKRTYLAKIELFCGEEWAICEDMLINVITGMVWVVSNGFIDLLLNQGVLECID